VRKIWMEYALDLKLNWEDTTIQGIWQVYIQTTYRVYDIACSIRNNTHNRQPYHLVVWYGNHKITCFCPIFPSQNWKSKTETIVEEAIQKKGTIKTCKSPEIWVDKIPAVLGASEPCIVLFP
jgi:hypothetical protein